MNLQQFLDRLNEMDPDELVDMLEISAEEIMAVPRFVNKARAYYYKFEAEDNTDED